MGYLRTLPNHGAQIHGIRRDKKYRSEFEGYLNTGVTLDEIIS